MSTPIDVYHLWLGIPPEEQPPDHYRLLGIRAFEGLPEVIDAAANRQIAHLRVRQHGDHAAAAQKLLAEVGAARACLLDPVRKATYDRQLREALHVPAAGLGPPAPPPGPLAPATRTAALLAAGSRLGEYVVLEKLGQGGMGAVYKALHTEMERTVALKLLPPGLLEDERAVARFRREIKTIAQLKHPNIVEAHDAREIEGLRLLVMEYVEGTDLYTVCKEHGPLPATEACEIARRVALGLQCVHEHGLVHRDIKPSNLMLTPQGEVKILDLGLARTRSEQPSEDDVTGTGEAMGTVDYMAPEQILDSRGVDIRADIYSLGCTLYRFLAARPPFSGPKYDTAGKKLLAHMQERPGPIGAARPDLPPALALVVERMMAKSPDERFATPAEVAAALSGFAARANLKALAAHKLAPTPPHADQAVVPTVAPQSSGLTQFLRTIGGRGAPPVAGQAAPPGHRALPPYMGYVVLGAVALVVVVALGMLLSGRPRRETAKPQEDQTPVETPAVATSARVILDWPAPERRGATASLDGRDITPQVRQATADRLSMTVNPGTHAVRLERPGFEPCLEEVKVPEGGTATVSPVWKKPTPKEEPPDFPDVIPSVEKPGDTPKPPPEKPEPPLDPKPPPPKPKPQPKIDPAIAAREGQWRSAVDPVDRLAAAWDFAAAQAALEKVRFDDASLQERLAQRQDELKRMAALKAKMIARVNAASPRIKKSQLMLRGMAGGEVTGADQDAIHATLPSGKTEDHPWAELNEKARPKLIQLAIAEDSADDWLAGGLMAIAAGDVALAESALEIARSLGTDVGPHLGSLAAAALARAQELLDQQKWPEAEKALEGLQTKYVETPWFTQNRPLVEDALAKAKSGIYESEADKLYSEAARLFEEKELFEVRTLVDNLKAEYADSRAVTEPARKPSFAELEKATSSLGKRLTVARLGKDARGNKTDFTSIQAAIDSAPNDSLIEIVDNGPHHETVFLPREKKGLTVRGKKGCWPVIQPDRPVEVLFAAHGPSTRVERLVLIHSEVTGEYPHCLHTSGGCRVRNLLVFARRGNYEVDVPPGAQDVEFAESIVLGRVFTNGNDTTFRNCLLQQGARFMGLSRMYSCVATEVSFERARGDSSLGDSIVGKLRLVASDRIENCATILDDPPRHSKNSFRANPQFLDPANLDYRLAEKSPCRGKASDGGDLGVRWTPEMLEMVKIANDLRAKGIIKF